MCIGQADRIDRACEWNNSVTTGAVRGDGGKCDVPENASSETTALSPAASPPPSTAPGPGRKNPEGGIGVRSREVSRCQPVCVTDTVKMRQCVIFLTARSPLTLSASVRTCTPTAKNAMQMKARALANACISKDVQLDEG